MVSPRASQVAGRLQSRKPVHLAGSVAPPEAERQADSVVSEWYLQNGLELRCGDSTCGQWPGRRWQPHHRGLCCRKQVGDQEQALGGHLWEPVLTRHERVSEMFTPQLNSPRKCPRCPCNSPCQLSTGKVRRGHPPHRKWPGSHGATPGSQEAHCSGDCSVPRSHTGVPVGLPAPCRLVRGGSQQTRTNVPVR